LCREGTNGPSNKLKARILQAFKYIEENWTELYRQPVEDESGTDIATALRERAWLPAESGGRGFNSTALRLP
jgi:hypothetical protein